MREGCEGAWELGDVSVVVRRGVRSPETVQNASCAAVPRRGVF